jgi:SAM-dependent methyltransferase
VVAVSGRSRPVGTVTRGTTNPNRLRRMDRWLTHTLARRMRAEEEPPVVVDLGYGASPVTVLELHRRLAAVRPDVQVVGIEISPERVAAALPYAAPPAVRFVAGGFELPVPQRRLPLAVRAANVLRQYDETEVPAAWELLTGRLAPGGVLVEGTCDEFGRLGSWVDVRAGPGGPPEPRGLTLSWRLAGLARPSVVAERLPKVLIHRNVPGEPVHELLRLLDECWERQAPHASFGVRQRWLATVGDLRDRGWPVLDGPRRWRLGELTVPWASVAPQRGESRS